MCLKLSMLVANFAASIFENVSVELCRVEMFDVVVYDFMLFMEMFDVLGWSDAGRVTVLEDGDVIVCSSVNYGSPV